MQEGEGISARGCWLSGKGDKLLRDGVDALWQKLRQRGLLPDRGSGLQPFPGDEAFGPASLVS